MLKIPKSIVAIAAVLTVSAGAFAYYFLRILPLTHEKAALSTARPEPSPLLGSKEVSATTTYEVPEAEITHNIKFTVVVDEAGNVAEVKMVEMPKAEASEKQKEFARDLTVMIKGKKLSELSKIDKVGKSTLTTAAFNAALTDLKAAL